ncbi:MAG: membrane-binding protein, partial [Planctomycetaceae bacterium]|nr:membrane-binding protein [Planctomycetaceae bacterium]
VGCGVTVDGSKLVERDGLWYEGDSETPFTGVSVEKYENGQKREQATFKDGKLEGPYIFWHANGQKKGEGTFKDGKREGLQTIWYKNGQKNVERTYKDGRLVSETFWDEEGNETKE